MALLGKPTSLTRFPQAFAADQVKIPSYQDKKQLALNIKSQ